jgi:hypothetical protein
MNLKSFGYLKRGAIRSTFMFVARESFVRFNRGERNTIKHEGHLCHVKIHENGELGCYAFTDGNYPQRVIYNCIGEALTTFYKEIGGD